MFEYSYLIIFFSLVFSIVLSDFIDDLSIKVVSFIFSIFLFFVVIFLFVQIDFLSIFFYSYTFKFSNYFNINFTLGVDQLSVFLLLLIVFLFPLIILTSWNSIKFKSSLFYINIILLEFFLINVFISFDLLFFNIIFLFYYWILFNKKYSLFYFLNNYFLKINKFMNYFYYLFLIIIIHVIIGLLYLETVLLIFLFFLIATLLSIVYLIYIVNKLFISFDRSFFSQLLHTFDTYVIKPINLNNNIIIYSNWGDIVYFLIMFGIPVIYSIFFNVVYASDFPTIDLNGSEGDNQISPIEVSNQNEISDILEIGDNNNPDVNPFHPSNDNLNPFGPDRVNTSTEDATANENNTVPLFDINNNGYQNRILFNIPEVGTRYIPSKELLFNNKLIVKNMVNFGFSFPKIDPKVFRMGRQQGTKTTKGLISEYLENKNSFLSSKYKYLKPIINIHEYEERLKWLRVQKDLRGLPQIPHSLYSKVLDMLLEYNHINNFDDFIRGPSYRYRRFNLTLYELYLAKERVDNGGL